MCAMPSHQLQRSTEPSAPELRSRVTNAAVVYAIVFTARRHGGQDGFGLLKGKQTLFFFMPRLRTWNEQEALLVLCWSQAGLKIVV